MQEDTTAQQAHTPEPSSSPKSLDRRRSNAPSPPSSRKDASTSNQPVTTEDDQSVKEAAPSSPIQLDINTPHSAAAETERPAARQTPLLSRGRLALTAEDYRRFPGWYTENSLPGPPRTTPGPVYGLVPFNEAVREAVPQAQNLPANVLPPVPAAGNAEQARIYGLLNSALGGMNRHRARRHEASLRQASNGEPELEEDGGRDEKDQLKKDQGDGNDEKVNRQEGKEHSDSDRPTPVSSPYFETSRRGNGRAQDAVTPGQKRAKTSRKSNYRTPTVEDADDSEAETMSNMAISTSVTHTTKTSEKRKRAAEDVGVTRSRSAKRPRAMKQVSSANTKTRDDSQPATLFQTGSAKPLLKHSSISELSSPPPPTPPAAPNSTKISEDQDNTWMVPFLDQWQKHDKRLKELERWIEELLADYPSSIQTFEDRLNTLNNDIEELKAFRSVFRKKAKGVKRDDEEPMRTYRKFEPLVEMGCESKEKFEEKMMALEGLREAAKELLSEMRRKVKKVNKEAGITKGEQTPRHDADENLGESDEVVTGEASAQADEEE